MAGQLSLHARGSDVRREAPGSHLGGADAGLHAQRRAELIAGWPLSTALALRGLLALLFGGLALLWPGVTILALALLFGAYALVDAAGLIGSAFTRDTGGKRPRWDYLVAGLVGVMAGLMGLLWPQITGLALVMVAGAWAVATGVLEVTAAVSGLLEAPAASRARRAMTGDWLLAVVGIISIVAGIVALLRPEVGAVALATVLGVYALIAGAILLAAAWCLRDKPVVLVSRS